MNKKMTRKLAAGLAAVAMLTSAIPVTSFTAMAADEVVSCDFSSGLGDWSMYKEPKGDATLRSVDGKLAFTIKSVGDKNYAVQFGLGLIPMYKNAKYRLTYDISCTVERYVEGMIQQNGGDYAAYCWDGINVGPTPQTVVNEFTMEYDNDLMAKLVFNCGLQKKDPADLPEHTIYLDNVKLECLDDSGANKTIASAAEASIITNQIGYKPASKKTAVFRGVNSQTEFTVVDAATKETVYTGKLSSKLSNSGAGEDDWQGDFSSVKTPGKYIITCKGLEDSYPFVIAADPYSALFDDSIKMLTLQRCGEAVSAGKFSHPACHTGLATVYGTSQKIDVSGGWHDAGDYGRYVVAGAKAVGDLLYAYLANPNKAILDETKYELDWMLKMQADNGGVYHKVTCESFPGFVMPEEETAELIVTPISSTATADFCASMALAAQAYKESDSAYAAKCLAAAEKAWKYLEENPNFNFSNPSGVTTGEYGDKTDKDERYWAACQLYVTTGESKYLEAAEKIGTKDGLDWSTVGDYGNIALLNNPKADKTSSAYTKAKSTVISEADDFVANSEKNPYGVALTKFNWGSNMTVANAGIICAQAYQLTGEAKYLNAAEAQLHYLLGSNPLGTCFVTGYGTVSPEKPHHRPSVAQGEAMKGMLVGGVNSALEDDAAKAYLKDAPAYKCWIDNADSYSTNEITIYWNSPLTYLLTLTGASAAPSATDEPTEPAPSGDVKYGDVNKDGKVDIMDVIRINKFLLGAIELDAQAKANADVDLSKVVDSTDSLNILKYVVENITKLPVAGSTEQPTEPKPTETQPTDPKPSSIKDYGTAMDANATMVADFRTGDSGDFFASDGWTNGSCFDCWWHKTNTSLDGGMLTLTIDKDKGDKGMYSGAEYRTDKYYHYGYYETSMQAIKNDGVVSSFFTYTGPSDVINKVENPWDEIDIEILGKDTTQVQLNYYKNGKGGHEVMYDLGFDASEGFHTYGFDWQEDHITWYVDGKEIYTMKGDMPSTPSKIMMNTWPGVSDPNDEHNVIAWLKKYDGNTPLSAHYQWATYKQAPNAQKPRTLKEIEAEQASTQPTQAPTQAPTDAPAPTSTIKDYGTAMNANAKMVSDFRTGKGGDFFASDGWTNGSCFDCWWHKSNTSLEGGMLTLTIDQDKGGKGMYSGAEYRTNEFYGYGYFETSMQAIKNDGVVSSFFTYTGESDKNPWDEIDIEVLGKDTTKVQFNYYTDSQGKHEFMYDLGFDASEGFHTYGFDWQPGYIAWYVDGKEVHRATDNIPKTPGKIMMNTWPGVSDPNNKDNVIDWLKKYDGKTPLSAHYQWVTYNPTK